MQSPDDVILDEDYVPITPRNTELSNIIQPPVDVALPTVEADIPVVPRQKPWYQERKFYIIIAIIVVCIIVAFAVYWYFMKTPDVSAMQRAGGGVTALIGGAKGADNQKAIEGSKDTVSKSANTNAPQSILKKQEVSAISGSSTQDLIDLINIGQKKNVSFNDNRSNESQNNNADDEDDAEDTIDHEDMSNPFILEANSDLIMNDRELIKTCSSQTNAGVKCKRAPVKDSIYCGVHKKMRSEVVIASDSDEEEEEEVEDADIFADEE
jgi:hypothetical protein